MRSTLDTTLTSALTCEPHRSTFFDCSSTMTRSSFRTRSSSKSIEGITSPYQFLCQHQWFLCRCRNERIYPRPYCNHEAPQTPIEFPVPCASQRWKDALKPHECFERHGSRKKVMAYGKRGPYRSKLQEFGTLYEPDKHGRARE